MDIIDTVVALFLIFSVSAIGACVGGMLAWRLITRHTNFTEPGQMGPMGLIGPQGPQGPPIGRSEN